jgi:hypothetical protein
MKAVVLVSASTGRDNRRGGRRDPAEFARLFFFKVEKTLQLPSEWRVRLLPLPVLIFMRI